MSASGDDYLDQYFNEIYFSALHGQGTGTNAGARRWDIGVVNDGLSLEGPHGSNETVSRESRCLVDAQPRLPPPVLSDRPSRAGSPALAQPQQHAHAPAPTRQPVLSSQESKPWTAASPSPNNNSHQFYGSLSSSGASPQYTPQRQQSSGVTRDYHHHSDTYETPLPAEALGAKQLVDFLFQTGEQQGAYSHLSPPDATMRPAKGEIGLPVALASEPVNPQTGRRLVYFGRSQPPVAVKAEPRNRFIAIAKKPIFPLEGGSGGYTDPRSQRYTTSYGVVLGYSDDNTQIVWHDRSERFASRVALSDILMIHRTTALQCRHCGLVLLRDELGEHLLTHKKGSGLQYGVHTDDPVLGLACGDTGLLQCMIHPKRLGEGAQGIVELCDIAQPTAEEEARAGQNSLAFSHPSRHLAQSGKLTKAVMKTIHFDTAKEGIAEYQKSVRLMTVMNHEHLVEYLAVQLLPGNQALKLSMPFYSEGDLSNAIRDCRGHKMEQSFICSIALQLSYALSFLHERNPPIVHGDIKVENVMFYNNRRQVVLMDLDASWEVQLTKNAVSTTLGTAAYMAPETMNNERLMPASDMWSLGVLLYVLAVMPQFPMITDPRTMGEVMLNAPSWATPEDQRAIDEFLKDTNCAPARPQDRLVRSGDGGGGGTASTGFTLGDCVRENVSRRGYSSHFTQLIVDLLSYNPWKRPSAEDMQERVTEIMTNELLGS